MAVEMPRIGAFWEDVCGYIIRPPRAEYEISELGPKIFRINSKSNNKFIRTDVTLENMRGLKIECSWFHPVTSASSCWPLPVVVYLHGNCGSRVDSLEILHVLEEGITLFAFDACGSGQSEGTYVSLGFYERQDLATVIEYLQSSGKVSGIALWGRSMGAVTSIMYASRDPTIKCVIGDSPFSSLRRLVADLVADKAPFLPAPMTKMAIKKIRKKIAKMANFDIDDLDSIKYAAACVVPSFLFHGEDDDFVRYEHSLYVANSYKGSCIHKVVAGSHNSTRKMDVTDVSIPFLRLYLIDKPLAEKERKQEDADRLARIEAEMKENHNVVKAAESADSSSMGGVTPSLTRADSTDEANTQSNFLVPSDCLPEEEDTGDDAAEEELIEAARMGSLVRGEEKSE
eukprot:Tbor_TRINITY_DN5405_c1_g2::TRINITY_DN5405_c1_g2_i1::g.24109::m.24109